MESVLDDPGDPRVRELFPSATHESSLADLVHESSDTQAAVAGPVGTISLAGRAVAMIAVGVAAAYGARRRRIEVGLLMARGARPAGVGARAAVESLLPVMLGSAAGWILALTLVRRLGPGSALDPGAERWAALLVATVAVVALALVAGVTAVAAVRQGEEPERGRLRELASRAPWEGLVLLLAAAAYVEIALRGGGAVSVQGGTPRLDVLVLLFPMLFVAGLAGLAGRLLARALPAVRRAGTAWRPSLYLAARRIAATPRMTMLLVTAGAIALGILVYASSLAGSVRESLGDKALVLNGAPTRVVLGAGARTAPGTPSFPATEVIRARGATIEPSGRHVDLLGIDRATFLRVASGAAFRLDRPPADAVAALRARPGERIPVVVAGGSIPPGATLDVGPLRLRLQTAARGAAFPGLAKGRPLVVIDRAALESAMRTGETSVGGLGADREVWSSAPATEVVAALRRASVPVDAVRTTTQLRQDPSFTPVSWIFGLLQALGVLAGLVASIGVVLYMQARRRGREVSFALASRMGLGRGPHRLSVAVELVVVLGAGLVVGSALALTAAALVARQVDLLPAVAPHPSLWVPWVMLGGAAVAIILAAALGAWGVQRGVERAKVAEVIRLVD
jgi:hypothetical protein